MTAAGARAALAAPLPAPVSPPGAGDTGDAGGAVTVPPDRCPLVSPVQVFSSSSADLSRRANLFWYVYLAAEVNRENRSPEDIYGIRYGDNQAWTEWDSLKFGWTNRRGYRDHAMDYLKTAPINGLNVVGGSQPPGYVRSWGGSETWPDANDAHHGQGSYHFDQVPRFVAAAAHLAVWSRSKAFIEAILPRTRLVMDQFLLEVLGGSSGILTIPGAASNGTSGARPTTYMDQPRSGFQDAWINATFYSALRGMADLETMAGHPDRGRRYAELARHFPAKFDRVFWNPRTSRYAWWVDATGAVHDAGYTIINLEAIARGITSRARAQDVFDFLARPAQPTESRGGPAGCTAPGCVYPPSAHPGSSGAYQDVVAVRVNTEQIPEADWDGWSDYPTQGRRPYGAAVENGGALLWVSYYDVMARLAALDADNAMDRFSAMLGRMASDSHFLTFSSRPGRAYDDFGESMVEIGSNDPFPESGIAVLPLLHGFMGVNATVEGLEIAPNLPARLAWAQASPINYGGQDLTVKVSRGRTVMEQSEAHAESDGLRGPAELNARLPLPARSAGLGDRLWQVFRPGSGFNEVGLLVSAPPGQSTDFTVELTREEGGSVAARRFTGVRDRQWLYVAFPDQPAGRRYRLSVQDPAGMALWYQSTSALPDASAYRNGAAFSPGLVFRALSTRQEGVFAQEHHDIGDRVEQSPGQVFHAPMSFSRVSLTVDTDPAFGPGGLTAVLFEWIGGSWRERQRQLFRELVGESAVTLSFAAQPPGRYLLELGESVGRVKWLRESAGHGAGFQALLHRKPTAGLRAFTVYRGFTRVEIPERRFAARVPAGGRCIVKL